jgi:UDP-N-acetylmuramoyl-L-alanyl-D-glutamate--2,6-diaminopimelate ligase
MIGGSAMKLNELLESVALAAPAPDCEITHLTCDSRQVTKGSVYFCLKGFAADGHDYAKSAVERGAAAVVCEHSVGLPCEVITPDTHYAYAVACGNYYGNPQTALKLIGVTGTNGKTTVTHLLRDVLRGFGKKVGMIGTIETDIDGVETPARYTTPDPLLFFSLLEQMKQAGCEYVVMEVSSHGLDQKRTGACRFAAGVFTNLTQDHLDYHKTMEAYFEAKKSLFPHCDVGLVNGDDPYGLRIRDELPDARIKTFSSAGITGADYTARDTVLSPDGSKFVFVGTGMISRVRIATPGAFSVSNAMAALSCLAELGFPAEESAALLGKAHGVPGRFEVLPTDTSYTVIRDYAHAPDAVEKVLATLRTTTAGRIVILLGCAGNRDRTKRKKMTDAAARLADFVILTSDNPRSEDPMQIIGDAMPGLQAHDTPYEVIPDRYEAISWALDHMRDGDTLLLAGKGHEDYQVLSHATVHFDEREIVNELLEKKRAKQEE